MTDHRLTAKPRSTDRLHSTNRRTRASLAIVGIAGALAVAGCGSSHSSAAPATSAAPGATSAPTGTAVSAVETEFKIALSQSVFKAGAYTFTVVNKGHLPHSLVILEGTTTVGHTPDLVSPGSSASFSVTLAAGTYNVICGVPGHKAAGMDTVIHVS